MWQLQAGQCFFLVILVFAVIGFIRGWRREIVSLAFILAAILIVGLGGGTIVAQALFVRLPLAFQDPNNLHPPGPPSAVAELTVTVLTLVVLVALGYYTGNRAFPGKPANPADRVWGIIPGIIAGISVYSILGRVMGLLTSGPNLVVYIPAPNASIISTYLLFLFIILVVLIIIGLVTSSAKKGGGAPKK